MANEQIGDMTKLASHRQRPPGEFNLLEYKQARTVTNDGFWSPTALATDAIWKVPDMPRIEFGAAPCCYKVQLLTTLDPSQPREMACALLKQFADDFSAAFQTHVNAADHAPSEKPAT